MASDKNIQKAGDNSNQFHVENLTIVNGLTEQRARELYSEMSLKAIKECTQEATAVASARAEAFANDLIPRVEKIEKDFKSFSEPAFQFLLKNAQKVAVCSGRDVDYALLSELLVHRIKRGTERKTGASIVKAVEIVDQVDDDALCGITIAHVIGNLYPVTGYIYEGMDVLENLYNKLLYTELPEGYPWLEHLEMLNAIKITPFSGNQKIDQIFARQLSGYLCAGIEKGSDNYSKAVEILRNAMISDKVLIEHELLEGYVRLPVANKLRIKELEMIGPNFSREANNNEIDAFEKVLTLYDSSNEKKELVTKVFMEEIKSRKALKKIYEFWNKIPRAIEITPIGRVLAHANAQRCDSGIPDFT